MKKPSETILNRSSTLILRLTLIAAAVLVIVICMFALPALWRDVTKEVAFNAYVLYGILTAFYIAAIPFLFALYQAYLLLGYIDSNKAFSLKSVRALKKIAYCGIGAGITFVAIVPLFFIWADRDDAPGLVIIAMALAAAPFVVSIFAAVMQRLLRQAIAFKKENDLTV